MSGDDPRSLQIDDLTQVAYRLAMAFGREAECAETPLERRIEFFHLFDRCFFSVRVGIALQLRLDREAAPRPMAGRANAREAEGLEALERDRPERAERYDERDRDRERETVSLPVLLRTLEGVAADAAALPDPPPAELPTLRELLAQLKAGPAAPATTSAPPRPALRSRLSGSTATLTVPKPRLRAAPPIRRATGPP